MYKDTFDKIDELAKAKKISRRRLAQMAGINVNTMSSLYKRRPAKFPEKYIEPIANALGVAPSELKNSNNLTVLRMGYRDISAAEGYASLGRFLYSHKAGNRSPAALRPVSAIMSDLEVLSRAELQIVAEYISILLQDDQL